MLPWRLLLLSLLLPVAAFAAEPAAPASVVVDAATGQVLAEENGGQLRHPASLTKLMTVYVAFRDMAAGRARPEDRMTVSERAAGQGGSVLGLTRGASMTLTEALRAIVVRSANDAAVAVAEHLGTSEPAFALRMSAEARRLGMNATSFANSTGLTAPGQLSTPRDMAVLALALKREFPQHWPLFSAREVEWRKARLPTINGFLGAYSGAEGMKTGFTCPAGYNLAAAASRGGKGAVAVVMGARSKDERATLVARLLDRAFKEGKGPAALLPPLAALAPLPPLAALTQLANLTGPPPDLSAAVCAGGGVPGDSGAIAKRVPAGWAVELAFGRDQASVRRTLAAAHRQVGKALGGGVAVIVVRPFDGGLRYRGIIAGLAQDKAIPTCLKLREQDEERCLVLSPAAIEGALDEERRWRMIAAR